MTSSHSVLVVPQSPGRGSRADLLENDSLSWASSTLLSECVIISDQGYSLRVIHVLVGKGIAHVQTLGEGSGSGPHVSSDSCLTGSSGLEWMSPTVVDCQTSVLWFHCTRTRSADPRAQTRRQASIFTAALRFG